MKLTYFECDLEGPASLSSASFIHGNWVPGISGNSSSDELIFELSEITDDQISNSSGVGNQQKLFQKGLNFINKEKL